MARQIVFTMVCMCAVLACATTVQGVVIETVPVGNTGNAGEWSGGSYGGYGPDRICGAVGHWYKIGKYEVTNGQYAEFLNAVATVGDAHGLYNTDMGAGLNDIGGISRSGSGTGGDPWVYAVRTNRGERPVNYVSWYDALRFSNWLHNGQPSGTQDAGTTENGSYDMSLGASVVRKLGATWVLPTEDEWYKAAYYKGGGTSAGYWDYPTASDTVPAAEAPAGTDAVNGSANYHSGGYVDTTYYTTEVGAYTDKPSDSAYGTFDQGGNVLEWNETIVVLNDVSYRGVRGGSYSLSNVVLKAAWRNYGSPTEEWDYFGFRVSEVIGEVVIPEPATIALLALGGVGMVIRRRGVRR